MDFSFIIKSILKEVSEELKKKENITLLRNDILNPVISHIITELYPYIIRLIIVIMLIFIFLIITIFLNIKIILK
tara:strand:- start:7322 stop:7546 length:225 start_codon:yes stop_codon:yes gene_type:complete